VSAVDGGAQALLAVRDLTVEFRTRSGGVRALHSVTLDVAAHEVLSVVGESGSGKSLTMLAIMGLLPPGARVVGGEVWLRGRNLLQASAEELRAIRGRDVAMIFQDPMMALNPVLRIGGQIAEMIRLHQPRLSRAACRARVVDLLDLVGVPDPAAHTRSYPHEFSGGMRQRAMIAMALANDPALLIADEPTTALDVTIGSVKTWGSLLALGGLIGLADA